MEAFLKFVAVPLLVAVTRGVGGGGVGVKLRIHTYSQNLRCSEANFRPLDKLVIT